MQDRSDRSNAAKESFSIRSRVVVAFLLAAALIAGCGSWAVRAQLSGAVIAHGKVVVKRQLKQMQHRDGGIVGAILVENGDEVQAGDVVIRLDPTQTRAELGVIKSQLLEYCGRRARLIAERDGEQNISFAAGYQFAPESAAIADGEMRLFAENRALHEAQRDQLTFQVRQYEEQVRGLEAQKKSNAAERAILAGEFERIRQLVGRRLIETAKVRSVERDLAKVDGKSGEIAADIARVKGQISETRLKLIELDKKTRAQAQKEVRDLEAKIAVLSERKAAAEDKLSRMELRAPISGTVTDLAIHTVSGVISPGQTMLSIVPKGELIVEARVPPVDIDQIAPGQRIRLRFSAFNMRTTPEIEGVVSVVGAAATTDRASGQSYYLTTIVIADKRKDLDGRHLVPGMPVEAFFETKQRTALSYLVKPFTDQMMRSFRED